MVAGGLILAVGLAFLLGFVVQGLWNWLMPPIFGLPEITYWQAWGLFLLAHLLLGGGMKFQNKHKHYDKNGRNRFFETLKERWPHGAPHDGESAPDGA
jgi:hypothetical protein